MKSILSRIIPSQEDSHFSARRAFISPLRVFVTNAEIDSDLASSLRASSCAVTASMETRESRTRRCKLTYQLDRMWLQQQQWMCISIYMYWSTCAVHN